ncbi:MAG TPA: ADOP family duplicated permease [Terriglobia bacterium]|nr:ADOP family duplicated permease [Terriglobia bacterium]
MNALLSDLRYGFRMFAKNPGFTAVAVITLALGIGANSAIFSLTYAVILKSLPVPNPQELVRYTFSESGVSDLSLSGPVYEALRRHETVNQGILAWSGTDLAVQEGGTVTRAGGGLMTGNGFRVLALRPYLGRVFGEGDDVSGGGPNGYQALLGYDYWKQHFGQDSAVIGNSIKINGRAVTIIGVLPAGFDGLIAGERAEIVLPLAFEEVIHAPHPMLRQAGSFWLTVIGRLKPGETLKSAAANLKATDAVVREEGDPSHLFLRGFFAPFQIGVENGRGGRSFLKVDYSRPLLALEVLVGLLLLLCCANTGLLFLARVSSRFREFAVRSALGAPRGRLFQQVLSEVGLLAACGLAAGVWLGWVAARSLVAMLWEPGQSPALDVTPRVAILAFAAGISVLSALVAGLWPAIRASRAAPALDLKRGEALSSSKRLGEWIVPMQVAVSVTLLVAASLLGGAFLHLLLENSGFDTEGVTMADVDLSAAKPDRKQAARDAHQIVEALENAPGIQAATILSAAPLANGWSASHYFSLGQRGTVHTDLETWPESISPGYFTTMGTRILEGRALTRADDNGSQVCVLGASAARYFFPNEDPVGRFVYSGGNDPKKDGSDLDPRNAWRVAGVAEDARFQSLREAPPRMLYTLASRDDWGAGFSLAVRTVGAHGHVPLHSSATLAADALRNVVRQVVPSAPSPTIYTFKERINAHLQQERMLTALSACFAAIALLLTALGLYGLLARSVTLRTREIGLRLALGASPQSALTMVVRHGVKLTLAGAAVGLVSAVAVTRLLRGLLSGVQATNGWMLAGVPVAICAIALGASYLPARRATKVDPMEALRYE